MWEEREVLRHVANATEPRREIHAGFAVREDDIVELKQGLLGFAQAGNEIKQGSLARARGAEDRGRKLFDREIEFEVKLGERQANLLNAQFHFRRLDRNSHSL